MRYVIEFLRNEEGPTAVEYAVMLALILAAAIGAITSFGVETATLWTDLATKLP